MLKYYFIKIRKSYGRHTDVYVDFEEQIQLTTGWKPIKAANKYFQRIYNIIISPLFKKRILNFDLNLTFNKKCLFAIISGTQYSKIFLNYSFKAKKKVIYMFDPWPPLNDLNENAFRSFKINVAIFPSKQAVEYFNSRGINNFKSYYVPEGVQSDKYKFKNYSEKEIDLFQYGRQWKWLHEKLAVYTDKNNIRYEYNKFEAQSSTTFMDRNTFVETLSNAKVAVCVPRNITHPELVDSLSTLTTRYFECMSSKCLIWGKAPDELINLFGYNPVIEVDMENPDKQLSEILSNYNSYIPLIEKNYANVIANHQWKNRIENIMSILESEN